MSGVPICLLAKGETLLQCLHRKSRWFTRRTWLPPLIRFTGRGGYGVRTCPYPRRGKVRKHQASALRHMLRNISCTQCYKAPLPLILKRYPPRARARRRFSLALGPKFLSLRACSEQVTKHAGSVQKGFALIGGILVTAVVQSSLERSALTPVR